MAESKQGEQSFGLQRIYIKDLSFEAPKSPMSFKQAWQPQMNLDLNARNSKVEEELHEVVLKLTLTCKQEDATAYLIEIEQAGVFKCSGFEEEALNQVLGALCPSILFPYARATIDSTAVKGGFPAIMLAPINFDAFYQQALQKAQQEGAKQH